MNWHPKSATLIWLCILVAARPYVSTAQWVAYNDHASGPGTHPNATRFNILGEEDGTNGFLKNVFTGTPLPVKLTISREGVVLGDPSGSNPAPGTSMETLFGDYVDFSDSDYFDNVGMRTGGSVTYTFTGLDPTRTYRIQAGAVRGQSAFTNRWTLAAIVGADSFTASHSLGALTMAQVAEIAPNQVALNFGANHAPETGDLLQWIDIVPGADGAFALVVSRYTGTVPGGSSGTATSVGYAPTAIRLEDHTEYPVTILTHPVSQSASPGGTATFSVVAFGLPILYQWFRDGLAIPNATQASYKTPVLTLADSGSKFSVMVSNRFNMVQSMDARLFVIPNPTTALAFSQVWRYDTSYKDLGTAWREVGYDDSSWRAGPGPLGDETAPLPEPIRTPMTRTNILTYYFRTTFEFPMDPVLFDLQVTNMLDDGAVFYLNGSEWFRVGMAPGTVDFDTPANRTIGDANFEWFTVTPNPLVQGINVLAVELHQVNTTGSDMVFGTRLRAVPTVPTPLEITAQPQNLDVEELKPASLSVSVSGTQIRYQWFHNGLPIAGATRPVYTIASSGFADSGMYQVRAYNALFETLSQPAVLTVLKDTNAPVVLRADGSLGSDQILLTFSEPVSGTSAADPAHYQVSNTWGQAIQVLDVTITSPTQAVLRTVLRPPGFNYLVTASDIADVSSQANRIDPHRRQPVLTQLLLASHEGLWDFYDPFPGVDLLDLGTVWKEPNYTLGESWGQSPGAFVYDLGGQPLPVPVGTILSQGAITKYFRNAFEFIGSPLSATLQLHYVVDDGAIVYLNGVEVHRYNMPQGPTDYLTTALSNVPPRLTMRSVPFETETLRAGWNVLAAELHGFMPADLDSVFAGKLSAEVRSLASGPVLILQSPSDLTVMEGQPATFTFDAVGPNAFQWFENGVAIEGADKASLHLDFVSLSQSGASYHVLASNGDGFSAASASAVMTVIPDTVAPTLVTAYFNHARDRIVVTFSEPVDEQTAADPAHYSLGDGTSVPPAILEAEVINGNQVELILASPFRQEWLLTVEGVRDTARLPNTIRRGSQVRIGFNGPWFDFLSEWKWEASGTDLGTAWRTVGYNDAGWPSSPGPLGFPVDEPLPQRMTLETLLPRFAPGSGSFLTNIYFRKSFDFYAPTSSVVTLSNLIDDGAVFYLNGTELGRIAMPTGTTSYRTFAVRQDDIASNGHGVERLSIASAQLLQGLNLIAVEVHQGGDTSPDLIFGSMMHVFVPSEPLPPGPEMHIAYLNGEVTIMWEGTGFKLEFSDRADAPDAFWSPVIPQANPYRASANAAKRFYRLRK